MTGRMSTAEAIGALTAQVAALNKAFDEERHDRRALGEKAAKERADARAALADLQAGQTDLLRRVNDMEPVTKMVTGWKARLTGALMLAGYAGAVIWAGAVFFKDWILALWGE